MSTKLKLKCFISSCEHEAEIEILDNYEIVLPSHDWTYISHISYTQNLETPREDGTVAVAVEENEPKIACPEHGFHTKIES